jgi:hypothetical protein
MFKVLRYAPSQNGLLADSPQLQRPKTVLPYKPYTIKLESVISKSPSILMDLLLLIISLFYSCNYLFFEFKGYKIDVHHFVFSSLFTLKPIYLNPFIVASIKGNTFFLITTTEESPIVAEPNH